MNSNPHKRASRGIPRPRGAGRAVAPGRRLGCCAVRPARSSPASSTKAQRAFSKVALPWVAWIESRRPPSQAPEVPCKLCCAAPGRTGCIPRRIRN